MYHGGGRALGLEELSSFWLATHRTGPATMGTNVHSVRCTCLTLTPPLRSALPLISSFTHSLLNLFSSARVSFCILLHVWRTMTPSFPSRAEEVCLMKPSWGQIIGWGGTVTTQNRSNQHQSNPHHRYAQHWQLYEQIYTSSPHLALSSSSSSIINIILFNKYS